MQTEDANNSFLVYYLIIHLSRFLDSEIPVFDWPQPVLNADAATLMVEPLALMSKVCHLPGESLIGLAGLATVKRYPAVSSPSTISAVAWKMAFKNRSWGPGAVSSHSRPPSSAAKPTNPETSGFASAQQEIKPTTASKAPSTT